jgi:hypothetical protein
MRGFLCFCSGLVQARATAFAEVGASGGRHLANREFTFESRALGRLSLYLLCLCTEFSKRRRIKPVISPFSIFIQFRHRVRRAA